MAQARMPPCGCEALLLRPADIAPAVECASVSGLSNGVLRVVVGPGTEWIRQITDCEAGVDAVKRGCGALVVLDDPGDTWSHGVDRFRDEVGRVEMRGEPRLVEAGPLRCVLRVGSRRMLEWILV